MINNRYWHKGHGDQATTTAFEAEGIGEDMTT
jgi:hypothetical protein